jgi:hypothetical protein
MRSTTIVQRRRQQDEQPSTDEYGGNNGNKDGNKTVITPSTRRRVKQKRRGLIRPRERAFKLFLGLIASLVYCFLGFWSASKTTTLVHLPIANVDVNVDEADWPLIHIVNTRFMQEQGHLTTLGKARLHLFETFCLPTMIHQSTQHFLWIIKTDPHLDPAILQELLALIGKYSNIYLVASNRNYLINPDVQLGAWRDGAEAKDILQSTIHSGNRTVLHQAIALREQVIVLETRLDADDGLHRLYLEYMQDIGLRRFRKDPSLQWLYWCSRRHMEWHPSITTTSSSFPNGIVNPIQHEHICITPGITIGYNVAVQAKDVPVHPHDKLYNNVIHSTACYDDSHIHKREEYAKKTAGSDHTTINKDKNQTCLELVDELLFCAIRSRSLTSAGMMRIDLEQELIPSEELSNHLWKLMRGRFFVNLQNVQETQDYLLQHQAQIAYENLLGQCTEGHSCKQQAKDELMNILSKNGNRSGSGLQQLEKEYPEYNLRRKAGIISSTGG